MPKTIKSHFNPASQTAILSKMSVCTCIHTHTQSTVQKYKHVHTYYK